MSPDEDGTGRLEFALDIVNTEFGDFCSKQVRSKQTFYLCPCEIIEKIIYNLGSAQAHHPLNKLQDRGKKMKASKI